MIACKDIFFIENRKDFFSILLTKIIKTQVIKILLSENQIIKPQKKYSILLTKYFFQNKEKHSANEPKLPPRLFIMIFPSIFVQQSLLPYNQITI